MIVKYLGGKKQLSRRIIEGYRALLVAWCGRNTSKCKNYQRDGDQLSHNSLRLSWDSMLWSTSICTSSRVFVVNFYSVSA